MKALPKRKGNRKRPGRGCGKSKGLNESPSQKEGKSAVRKISHRILKVSEKAPPKRKGNLLCVLLRGARKELPQ